MPGLLDTATAIPTVQTERLLLRGHRLADLDACSAMWADAEVTRYVGGKTFGRDEVWMRILRYVGHWALLGYGFWAIQEKASGRYVGEAGLGDFMRDIQPPLGPSPECGWVLAPGAHGRGYATEAVRAVLGWATASLGAPRTVCLINPENVASLRVAEKCGYREFRRATYKGEPAVLFER